MARSPSHVTAAGVSVRVQASGWRKATPDIARIVRQAAEAGLRTAFPHKPEPAVGLAVLLANDAAMTRFNQTWRGQDKATNVLAFPATETRAGERPQPQFPGQPIELGDVVLALETCAREAATQEKPFAHHVQHLVVHGVLHLLGYDHIEEGDAARMERLEIELLSGLDIADPYADRLGYLPS